MLDPRRMWPILAGLAALTVAASWLQSPVKDPSAEPTAALTVHEGTGARTIAITRSECLAKPERLWVTLDDGVECISYLMPQAPRASDTAVVFFEGDFKPEDMAPAEMQKTIEGYRRRVEQAQTRFGLPFIVIGRPGLMGSSGFHLLGGRRDEGAVMNAAVENLKQRHGYRRLVLAGQSGGARVVAQLLVLGRQDIACAVMGSGAYDIPSTRGGGQVRTSIFGDPGRSYLVPLQNAGSIVPARDRRTFVIGDPRDTRTPFAEQRAWGEKLQALGHHAVLIEANGQGPEHHGLSSASLLAAGLCVTGKSDEEIRSALAARDRSGAN